MSVLARADERAYQFDDVSRTRPRGEAPVRVLHVLNRLATGGTENVVLQLIRGLSDGTFAHYVLPLRGVDPSFDRQRLPGGMLEPATRDDGSQFLVIRLAQAMRACKPHVVHSRNWGAIESIPAARLARVPVAVHSEHGYELDMLAGLPTRRRLFRRAAYAMADTVFTVTRELREYHARQAWVSPDRIRVLSNGVDTVKFFPRPEARQLLRRKFCLPENPFIVGTVGRMVPLKDHPTLLHAVEKLVRQGIDAHVVLVGAGKELERNQALVMASKELVDRVTFLGPSEAVPEILNAIDVFVLTSISEGMSNTLLEAMASGLPVVATSAGGNAEVIESGRCGWLVNPKDVEALAERLLLLASQEKLGKKFGAAGRARAVEHFGLERMLRDYRNLYLELLARRGIRVSNR